MAEYKSIYTGEQIDAGIGKANTALQQETDPIFSASPVANVTSQDIANWNGKSNFSGSYNDLTDKPELFSGDYDDLSNKPNIPENTSDLTNDSGFITKSVNDLVNYYLKNEVYTKDEVTALIGAIQQFHYEVVQELPQTGANNIMYLVPKSTSQTNNVYDEYVYSNGWEKIGDTEIDLSNYVTVTMLNQALADYTTTANLTTLLAGKQDVIDSTHKLDADLVDDTNSTNKFFSGNYNDLTNKPTIPDELSDLTEDSTHRLVTDTEKTTWNGKQDTMQYSTMPTASAETVGKIVQYIGTTDTYTNGYFYIGITDGGDPATYSWSALNVQEKYDDICIHTGSSNYVNKDRIYWGDSAVVTNSFSDLMNYMERRLKENKPEMTVILSNLIFNPSYSVGTFVLTGLISGNETQANVYLRGYSYVNNVGYCNIVIEMSYQKNNPYNRTISFNYIPTNLTTTLLERNNVTSYNVTSDYNPAHKLYVDTAISNAVGSINTVLASLTTPSGNGGE